MGKLSTFNREETKMLLDYLKRQAPDSASSIAVSHSALLECLEKGQGILDISPEDAKNLSVHLQRTSPKGPGLIYIPHLYLTCDVERMTKEGMRQLRVVEKTYREGGFHEAIGVALGAVGYGEKKPGFSGKPSTERKTIHEIKGEFTNPRAKSQLMYCEECDVETRHTTPFFSYPFRCVVNHDGTTRCHGCGYDVDFISRVIVTGQHEHKSYCVACDKLSQEKENE